MFQEFLLTAEDFTFTKNLKGHWKNTSEDIYFRKFGDEWCIQFSNMQLKNADIVQMQSIETQKFSTLKEAKTVGFNFLYYHLPSADFSTSLTTAGVKSYQFFPSHITYSKQQKYIANYLGQISHVKNNWSYIFTSTEMLSTFKQLSKTVDPEIINKITASHKSRKEVINTFCKIINDHLPYLYNQKAYQLSKETITQPNQTDLWWTLFIKPEVNLIQVFKNNDFSS